MKKRLAFLLLSLMMFFVFCGYTKGAQRVFDYAGILEDGEAAELEEKTDALIEKLKCDIFLLSVEDAQGLTTMNYAENFFVNNDGGYEERFGTGVVFVIDMDNRNFWITTSGDAITYIDDARIDDILDDTEPYVVDGDYYEAYDIFLDDIEKYMWNEDFEQDHQFSGDTGFVSDYDDNSYVVYPNEVEEQKPKVPIAYNFKRYWSGYAFISIIVTIVVVVVGLSSNRSKMTVDKTTYLKGNTYRIVNKQDIYTHTTEHRVRINNDDNNRGGGGSFHGGGGSSVHIGGGGGTFGGGGRSF